MTATTAGSMQAKRSQLTGPYGSQGSSLHIKRHNTNYMDTEGEVHTMILEQQFLAGGDVTHRERVGNV